MIEKFFKKTKYFVKRFTKYLKCDIIHNIGYEHEE
mgnify:CR=1 FL=1